MHPAPCRKGRKNGTMVWGEERKKGAKGKEPKGSALRNQKVGNAAL